MPLSNRDQSYILSIFINIDILNNEIREWYDQLKCVTQNLKELKTYNIFDEVLKDTHITINVIIKAIQVKLKKELVFFKHCLSNNASRVHIHLNKKPNIYSVD
jgi:hypothetical protein